ncbi:MAG: cytidylate kinase-like family protein [Deltaproteobacteria bacterium]|nr:cytidylate kinase-like family protein [Deltaproteobacteria bacterium]MBW2137892.1 cytidylate kinase-like family protein [Deltaproteobacteria bacterium]
MTVITISRGSYSRGKEVAEKVARELGYECISREVLIEASKDFNVPEVKLIRALHDAPSVLDRLTHGKEKYIAYIRAALLEHVKKDNVVYHGLAGHFFLQDIPHVLEVRVIADLEDRVREEMTREGISAEEARRILLKDDHERRRWGLQLYGKDTWDCTLYDLVVHIKTKSVDDAVGLILHAARLPCFQTTPESQKMVEDLALAAEVKAALMEDFPEADTFAKDGVVTVTVEAPLVHEDKIIEKIKGIAGRVEGVKELRVHVIPIT